MIQFSFVIEMQVTIVILLYTYMKFQFPFVLKSLFMSRFFFKARFMNIKNDLFFPHGYTSVR